MLVQKLAAYEFLSTPSARRATSALAGVLVGVVLISIHALREEGDPEHKHLDDLFRAISIHALREEGDLKCTFADAYAQ